MQVFPSVLREVDNGAGAVPNGKMTRDPRTVEPIERGLVRDWEALESMWRYIFYTNLGWEMGNEGQVLLAEPLGTSKVIWGDESLFGGWGTADMVPLLLPDGAREADSAPFRGV